MTNVQAAHEKVREKGEITDTELYECINENKGLTEYELSKKLNWSVGKIHGAINRLKEKDLILTEKEYNQDKVKLLHYPTNWKDLIKKTSITKEELDEAYVHLTLEDLNNLQPMDWILALLGSYNYAPIHGTIMYIKEMFVVSKEVKPALAEVFKFYPKHYGPYSDIAMMEMKNLRAKGLVKITPFNSGGKSGEEFELTNEGKLKAKQVLQKLPVDLREKLDKKKEIMTQIGSRRLVRYVYNKYPEFIVNSKIRSEIENEIRNSKTN